LNAPPGPPGRRWIRPDHAAALVLVALGLAARVLVARRSFVLSDESLHLHLASRESLLEVYRWSLTNAHPPLFFLLLGLWQRVVGVGWELCLLPAAFGAAFLWMAYRWTRSLAGLASSLTTLALLAFLPQLVLLSAELRGYSLALFLVAGALVALERGIREIAPAWVALSAVSTGLALGTHYLALRSAIALFAYGAVRLLGRPTPRPVLRVWVASQAALGALFLFFYATHLSKLRGGGMERHAQSEWLRAAYLQSEDGPLSFVLRQTAALFRFLFTSPAGALVALVLVLGGLALSARERPPAAVLLALPFVLATAGGVLRLYPYGGTRHSIDLALYACAAIGIAVARLTGDRLWVPLALAGALAPAAFALGW
jgi:uncharacterized membrane protein